jgi:hypothetical protein
VDKFKIDNISTIKKNDFQSGIFSDSDILGDTNAKKSKKTYAEETNKIVEEKESSQIGSKRAIKSLLNIQNSPIAKTPSVSRFSSQKVIHDDEEFENIHSNKVESGQSSIPSFINNPPKGDKKNEPVKVSPKKDEAKKKKDTLKSKIFQSDSKDNSIPLEDSVKPPKDKDTTKSNKDAGKKKEVNNIEENVDKGKNKTVADKRTSVDKANNNDLKNKENKEKDKNEKNTKPEVNKDNKPLSSSDQNKKDSKDDKKKDNKVVEPEDKKKVTKEKTKGKEVKRQSIQEDDEQEEEEASIVKKTQPTKKDKKFSKDTKNKKNKNISPERNKKETFSDEEVEYDFDVFQQVLNESLFSSPDKKEPTRVKKRKHNEISQIEDDESIEKISSKRKKYTESEYIKRVYQSKDNIRTTEVELPMVEGETFGNGRYPKRHRIPRLDKFMGEKVNYIRDPVTGGFTAETVFKINPYSLIRNIAIQTPKKRLKKGLKEGNIEEEDNAEDDLEEEVIKEEIEDGMILIIPSHRQKKPRKNYSCILKCEIIRPSNKFTINIEDESLSNLKKGDRFTIKPYQEFNFVNQGADELKLKFTIEKKKK